MANLVALADESFLRVLEFHSPRKAEVDVVFRHGKVNEMVAGSLGEAKTHRDGLSGIVDDLDDGREVVEKPLARVAVKLLNHRRIAGDELEVFGWFWKHS